MEKRLNELYHQLTTQSRYLDEHNWPLFHTQGQIVSNNFTKLLQDAKALECIKSNGLLREKFTRIYEFHSILLERVHFILQDLQEQHRRQQFQLKVINHYGRQQA